MTTPDRPRPITWRTPPVTGRTIPAAETTCDVSYEVARTIYVGLVEHYRKLGHDITPHREEYVEQGSDRDAWERGGPVLCRDYDDNPAWAIIWEEGPWEWTYDDICDDPDLSHVNGALYMIEPVNTFSVRIYVA